MCQDQKPPGKTLPTIGLPLTCSLCLRILQQVTKPPGNTLQLVRP